MLQNDEPDYTRIFLAIFLSAILLIGWQIQVEWPRRQALAQYNTEQKKKREAEKTAHVAQTPSAVKESGEDNKNLTRTERVAASPRVSVKTQKLLGSIALKGARFDDLALLQYRQALDKDSPPVMMFSPNGDENGYFAHVGWISADGAVKVPDQQTLWSADKQSLTEEAPLTLTWNNGQGLLFKLVVSIDEHYMFTIAQSVENTSGKAANLTPYAYINRTYKLPETAPFLHEGPIGVMNDTLNEVAYEDLREKSSVSYEDSTGWFGISDHYWLAALIPSGSHHKITFSHYNKNNRDRFQVDSIDQPLEIASGDVASQTVRLFVGAKELTLLDHYANGGKGEEKAPIHLFDRALDFGSFYFLAKPACVATYYLYKATGNFGVALLIFIIFLKIGLFPLANKSYKSMAQMRELQPELVRIREKYFDDQIAMHKAMRELYKREKVNPAAGCLPVLLQIIIFLALFRGLNVMIEMRHAPFYGWIHDLSAPDPSNAFTLFGLLQWDAPSFLHLGLLPIIYCATMVIQTNMQPKPPDPVQAKMIAFMPYFMLILFDSMPSGFVLYWTWSNILSIFQQHLITKNYKKHKPAPLAATANG